MTVPTNANLEYLRSVDRADVYKAGQHAATLTRTANGVEFRYLDDWIERGDAAPVATTLPIGTAPMLRPGGALPSYFAGLLPRGAASRPYAARSRPPPTTSCRCCSP